MYLTLILALTGLLSCSAEHIDVRRSKSAAVSNTTNQVPPQQAMARPQPQQTQPSVQKKPCKSPLVTYKIFDPCFDFNPKDNVSAAELTERFPVQRSQVKFLHNGHEFFAARMQLLKSAQESVRIQSLTFTNDESSAMITNELIALAKKGVKIQIIVDAVHNFTVPEQEMYFKLQRNGIEVFGFQYLYLNVIDKVLQLDDFGLSSGEFNMRYHEKLFIVDSEIPQNARAIIGGSNIANRYFQVQEEEPEFMWRDRDVLLRGPVVETISESFDRTVTERKEKEKSNLLSSSNILWQLFSGVLKDRDPYNLALRHQAILGRLQTAEAAGLRHEWQSVNIRFIQSRPRFKEDFILPVYLKMIHQAKSSIKIVNSYFLPDNDFIVALVGAVQRGVEVSIITNHAKNTDFKQLQLLTRSYYKDLLELNDKYPGSVKIYEWAGHEVLQNNEGQNHSKFATFDDKVAIVGSYNLDPRSHKLNSESIVVYEGEAALTPYKEEFARFITPHFSQNVTYEDSLEIESNQGLKEKLELKVLEIIKPLL